MNNWLGYEMVAGLHQMHLLAAVVDLIASPCSIVFLPFDLPYNRELYGEAHSIDTSNMSPNDDPTFRNCCTLAIVHILHPCGHDLDEFDILMTGLNFQLV